MDSPGVSRRDGSTVNVGDRVEADGYYGTVQYIGEVPPTKGTWLGVEWDDPSRGKHDGVKDGKRYFHATNPTAGSFVRHEKVTLGIPCISAIRDRYGKIEDEHAGVKIEELYVTDATNKRTFLEMVGARDVNEKQSKLDHLLEAGLRGMFVYGPGLNDDLRTFSPNITELDLSQNLLSSWKDLSRITSQLQRLHSLNVSQNKLSFPDDPFTLATAFKSVTTLFINRMNYGWSEVMKCAFMFPSLSHLHACFNHIDKLAPLDGKLSGLILLNLEANQLKSWAEILYLGTLSQLQTFIVNGNAIDSIYFPDVNSGQKTKLFPKLKSLSVARNQIKKWTCADELNKLKSLEELNARGNPFLTTETEENGREVLIAKIAGLKMYHRTLISAEERKGSEIDYLKKFGKDWLESGGNRDLDKNNPSTSFLENHPRFMQLVEALGPPEDSEMKEESKTLKDTLISVKITSLNNDKVVQKKLPLSMTIQKLKALTHRLFKADTGEIKLSYISTKMEGPEIDLDNDLRQLSFYSVENNDTIKVAW